MAQDNWLKWAMELQALAQAGLAYTDNKYDIERFERIREIAAEMLTEPSGLPLEKVLGNFIRVRYLKPQIRRYETTNTTRARPVNRSRPPGKGGADHGRGRQG